MAPTDRTPPAPSATSAEPECVHDWAVKQIAEAGKYVDSVRATHPELLAEKAPTVMDEKGEREAAAWNLLTEAMIDEFLEDYEMVGVDDEGRDGSYTPSERERGLIKDAVMGLLCEAQERTYSTLPAAQPEAETSAEQWREIANRVWMGLPEATRVAAAADAAELEAHPLEIAVTRAIVDAQVLGWRDGNAARKSDAPVAEPVALTDGVCDVVAIMVREKLAAEKGIDFDDVTTDTDQHWTWRRALIRGGAEAAAALTRPPAPEEGKDAARDHIRALIGRHADLLEQSEYTYFELAYTRQTGWMAWITDKPLACTVVNPDRKILATGQGDTPDEACRAALSQGGGA